LLTYSEADLAYIFNLEFNIHIGSGDHFANGLLAWLPIENRTAFPGLLSLLWHFRC